MALRRARAIAALAVAVCLRPDLVSALPSAAAPALHVSGNALVDGKGRVVQLRGVNRSSPETLCLATGRTSYFYGPTDAASIVAMRSWGANSARVPVNVDCWLGRYGLPASGTAGDYRTQVAAYVRLLVAGGLNVVVTAYTTAPMPDLTGGTDVWRSLATTFRGDGAVLFDLDNEPHDVTWAQWRDGMQSMVTAVRSTGATNPLVLTGPSWGNDVSRWLEYRPADPIGNLVAGIHVYPASGCASTACLDERVAPVAAQVPVVVGETGDPTGVMLAALPAWADRYGIGYLAFTWNVAAVPGPGYHLVTAFDGSPTTIGATYRAHLLSRVGRRTSPLRLVPFRGVIRH